MVFHNSNNIIHNTVLRKQIMQTVGMKEHAFMVPISKSWETDYYNANNGSTFVGAAFGSLSRVQHSIELGLQLMTPTVQRLAGMYASVATLSVLNTKYGMPLNTEIVMCGAVVSGSAEKLDYLHYTHQAPVTEAVLSIAAKSPVVGTMDWLKQQGTVYPTQFLKLASSANNMMVLRYMHKEGVSFTTPSGTDDLSITMTALKHLDQLKWLCESGLSELDPKLILLAMNLGCLEAAQYLYTQGVQQSPKYSFFSHAIHTSNFDAFKWLTEETSYVHNTTLTAYVAAQSDIGVQVLRYMAWNTDSNTWNLGALGWDSEVLTTMLMMATMARKFQTAELILTMGATWPVNASSVKRWDIVAEAWAREHGYVGAAVQQ